MDANDNEKVMPKDYQLEDMMIAGSSQQRLTFDPMSKEEKMLMNKMVAGSVETQNDRLVRCMVAGSVETINDNLIEKMVSGSGADANHTQDEDKILISTMVADEAAEKMLSGSGKADAKESK